MRKVDAVIVGGGPAGASCARELTARGLETVILDKADFPRLKLCAGWVTPQVFRDLDCLPETYPHGIIELNTLHFHVHGIHIPVKTRQYSIRRYEFDHWLLNRANTEVIRHRVRRIEKQGNRYIVDDRFSTRYIVGAGGTRCPVVRQLFDRCSRHPDRTVIVSLEKEFQSTVPVAACHLWFFRNRLPGYAWLVPKAGGYINIGIGGKLAGMRRKNLSIRRLWDRFVHDLNRSGAIRQPHVPPRGYTYYLAGPRSTARIGNALIVGDALGMATRDMGEGIGPAVKSGQMAARSIVDHIPFRPSGIPRFSLPGIILAGLKKERVY